MTKSRLEAFSDGVLAIIITIMVLELKVPHTDDWAALLGLMPIFLSYVLSFIYVGIYWNNHHHLMHTCNRVNGTVLWANLHLLFWLSLVPFTSGWMGENHFASRPTALYGVSLLMPAIAYFLLQKAIVAANGTHSVLAEALGKDFKGKVSLVAYVLSVGLAFVLPALAQTLYVAVAAMWLVPDRRIERALRQEEARH